MANPAIDLDLVQKTWVKAVQDLLAQQYDVREVVDTGTEAGKVEVAKVRHKETDPPPNAAYTRRQNRPGSLPKLLSELPKDRNVQEHEHSGPPDIDLFHMARLVVIEARRLNAKGIFLRAPRISGDSVVFPVVNVDVPSLKK